MHLCVQWILHEDNLTHKGVSYARGLIHIFLSFLSVQVFTYISSFVLFGCHFPAALSFWCTCRLAPQGPHQGPLCYPTWICISCHKFYHCILIYGGIFISAWYVLDLHNFMYRFCIVMACKQAPVLGCWHDITDDPPQRVNFVDALVTLCFLLLACQFST